MRKRDESIPHDPPQPHPYITFFQRHLDRLRQHLNGLLHNNTQESSFVSDVYWEASEKEAFFHALSVNSRLRPDLIATCIGTKNQAEVLEYMTMLEQGAQDYLEEETLKRQDFPSAYEVSDTWLDWEEENAHRLRANEEIWGTNIDDGDLTVSKQELLGGVSNLTYGHLAVLDSMLKAGGDEPPTSCDGATTTHTANEGGSSLPVKGVGSRAHTVHGTTDSGSFGKSPLITSQSNLQNTDEDESNIQVLTPRSRRRHQKRMYMRRMRAQATGVAVNETRERLRPGRRKDPCAPSITTFDSDLELESADTAMSETLDSAGNSGRTVELVEGGSSFQKTYKRIPHKTAVSDFQKRHVNVESVAAIGLDIFNHRTIGRLSRHFISGYNPDLIEKDASIHTEALLLLSEILKDFLVQLIARVIALEEEHRRLRGRTKVWRRNTDGDAVDKSTIHFALKSMGPLYENYDQYFADLLGEDYVPQSHQQTGYTNDDQPVDETDAFPQRPLHLDLYPPHYRTTRQSSPWLSSAEGGSRNSESIMDVDTDEDELDNILSQEEALDREDTLADRRHEKTLWRNVPFQKKKRHRRSGFCP